MSDYTVDDLRHALRRMAGNLKFFPQEPGAQAGIMEELTEMVPSKEALDWLVATMVKRVGEWHGARELRGVLCWRFRPADGVETESSVRGFRSEDGEALTAQEHQQLKAGGYIAPSSREFIRKITGGK